jgi:hypothetical protein
MLLVLLFSIMTGDDEIKFIRTVALNRLRGAVLHTRREQVPFI